MDDKDKRIAELEDRVTNLGGEGQAAIIIPSGRPADAPSVPLPRAESPGDDAPATSAPPEASGAQERAQRPRCGNCGDHDRCRGLERLSDDDLYSHWTPRTPPAEAPAPAPAEALIAEARVMGRLADQLGRDNADALAVALGVPRDQVSAMAQVPGRLARAVGALRAHADQAIATAESDLASERAAREQAEARVSELESQLRTEREQAQEQIAALTLEVARLQTDASAVHASAVQARRAMTEVEERAANAALPWRRGQGLDSTKREVSRG